jgi:glycosyltransferase involved in cell wall biosynthesis
MAVLNCIGRLAGEAASANKCGSTPTKLPVKTKAQGLFDTTSRVLRVDTSRALRVDTSRALRVDPICSDDCRTSPEGCGRIFTSFSLRFGGGALRLGIVAPKIGFNDGQGRVNREIAAEALRQGHEVLLFTEEVDEDMAKQPGLKPVVAPPPSWLPSRLLRDQMFALRAYRQVKRPENRCDALLANGFTTWAPSDVNAVHFVHDSWKNSSWHPWRVKRDARSLYALTYNQLNAQLEKDAFRRSRRVVAISEKVKQDLIHIGVPEERICTILNGVDSQEFHPGPPERERFGLPMGVKIALFAGDLRSPRKNLDTLLQAQALVPDLHVAVAGREAGTPYPDLARKLGTADRVHFLGFQKDMPALMRSVDILAFLSRYEPCGLVLLEALASGLPVITARSTGGADFITPDVGIVLQDSEDVAGLAGAIQSLFADAVRYAAMSRAACQAAQRHTWQDMACRYIDLLREVADQRRLEHA